MRHDLDKPYTDLACDIVGSAPLLGRETGGYPEQGNDSVDTENLRGQGKEQG